MGDAIFPPGQGRVGSYRKMSASTFVPSKPCRCVNTGQTDQGAHSRFRSFADIGGCESCLRRCEHEFVLFFVPAAVSVLRVFVLRHGYPVALLPRVWVYGHFEPSSVVSTRAPEG